MIRQVTIAIITMAVHMWNTWMEEEEGNEGAVFDVISTQFFLALK